MTYKVKSVSTQQDPPAKKIILAKDPPSVPPDPDWIITDPTADEWVMANAAYPGTVSVTLDASGKRTMSRP